MYRLSAPKVNARWARPALFVGAIAAPTVLPAPESVVALLLLLAATPVSGPQVGDGRRRMGFVLDLVVLLLLVASAADGDSHLPALVLVAIGVTLVLDLVPLRTSEGFVALVFPLIVASGDPVARLQLVVLAAGCWFLWWRYPLVNPSLHVYVLLAHDLCGRIAALRWVLQAPVGHLPDEVREQVCDQIERGLRVARLLRPTTRGRLRARSRHEVTGVTVAVDAEYSTVIEGLLAAIGEVRGTECSAGRIRIARQVTGDPWEVAATIAVVNRLAPYPNRVRLDDGLLVQELRVVPARDRPARWFAWPTSPTSSSSTAATRCTALTTPCPAPA